MNFCSKDFRWGDCVISTFLAIGDQRPPKTPLLGPRLGPWVCKTFHLHREFLSVPPLWMIDWGWWGRGDGKIVCSCICCGESCELAWEDEPEILALASDLLDQAQWSADFDNLHPEVNGQEISYVLFRMIPSSIIPKWPKLPKSPKGRGRGRTSGKTATGDA